MLVQHLRLWNIMLVLHRTSYIDVSDLLLFANWAEAYASDMYSTIRVPEKNQPTNCPGAKKGLFYRRQR